jgi:hypothetical protein
MPYGKLSKAQIDALSPYVRGTTVHDLGAGCMKLSRQLLDLGASQVVAVDKEAPKRRSANPRIRVEHTLFSQFDESPDVAFLSWPSNHFLHGLADILRRARVVVYLGKNTDGTACGHWTLFSGLLLREALVYVPERKNTLIVYGAHRDTARVPLGEEMAAITQDARMWTFPEAEQATRAPAMPTLIDVPGRRRCG